MMAESGYGAEYNEGSSNHKIPKLKKKKIVKEFLSGCVDGQHQQVHPQDVIALPLPSLHVP